MAEQIADLVVNLDANTVSFQEQMGRVERQLLESSRKADVSTDRMRRLAERQAATISGIAENSASATTKMQASQAVAVDGMKGKWSEASRAVDETHQRIAELSARLREEQQQSQVTGDAQDRLTASFFRQIDAIKGAENSLQELRVIQEQIRVARASGNITQGDYLSLVTETATKERALAQAERTAAQAKDNYLQKLREQVALQGKTASQIQEYKAAQLGVTQQAAPLIAKIREQEDAWKRGAISAGQYRMAMRQLPMQITDITTSLASGAPIWLVAIQQGGQIKDSFGGVGNALKAMLGWLSPLKLSLAVAGASLFGLYKITTYTATQLSEFNKLIAETGTGAMTTGRQILSTAQNMQLAGVSFANATQTMKELLKSGSQVDGAFDSVAGAIGRVTQAFGYNESQTRNLADIYEKIQSDPKGGMEAMGKALRNVDEATTAHILSLIAQGRQFDASLALSQQYTESLNTMATVAQQQLSIVELMIQNINQGARDMWALLSGNVPGQDAAGKLAGINKELENLQNGNATATSGDMYGGSWKVDNAERIKTLQQQKMLYQNIVDMQKFGADNATRAKLEEDKRKQHLEESFKWGEKSLTAAEKRTKFAKEQNDLLDRGLITQKQMDAAILGFNNANKDLKVPKTPKGPQYRTPAGERAMDSTQSEMLALQAQLQVLRQHSGLNDTISQQRKDLWKAQAQFTVLEEAAGKRQLSAQEKSLLSSKDKVLALAEQKAALGDQIAQQERLNKLQDASTKYVTQMAEKQQALQRSAGLGDRAAQRESTFAQLRQGWQNQGGGLNDEGYQRQLQAAQDYYAAEDKLRGDWMAGASSAWSNYQDQAADAAGMTKSLFTGAFSGMENALASFVTTGKAGFKEFTVSILADLAKIALRMAMSQGLQSLFGAFGAGAGNNPGAVPMFANAKGGVYSSPSLSAYSGQVVNKPTYFAFAKGAGVMGEAGAEGIFPLKRGRDGKLGVAAIGGPQQGNAAPNVYITIEGGGNANTQADPGWEEFGKTMGSIAAQESQKVINRNLKPGQPIWKAIKGG